MEKNEIPWLSEQQCIERLRTRARGPLNFLAYSSILGGWTESHLGLLNPIDDHGFHRGDGVFEAVRFINSKPYLFKEHWDRMQISMKNIDLKLEMTFEEAQKIVMAGAAKLTEKDAIMRIYVTRGPGGFAADLRECIAPQFFVCLVK